MPNEAETVVPAPKPAAPEVQEPAAPEVQEPAAPEVPEPAAPVEPRMRYRGRVITHHGTRFVGTQELKHIVCDDGTEYDLSDADYRNEVHLSYPSNV